MKIDTTEIRQRLSNNTAIDAKEIQALCDEVEDLQSIISAVKYAMDNSRANSGAVYLGDRLEGAILAQLE